MATDRRGSRPSRSPDKTKSDQAKRDKPRRSLGRILAFGFLLLVVVVALVLLALPFRGVQGDAEAARDELQGAGDALRAGDLDAASTQLDSARGHVDRAREVAHGISGDVWQWVPVAGGTVRDIRHLVEALDDSTSIAEIGVQVYPQLFGDKTGGLVKGESIDLETLEGVLADLQDAGGHLRSGIDALNEIDGTLPVVGPKIGEARDQALAQLGPLANSYDRAEPLMTALPRLLGGEEEQNYLMAILNPAALRYSGGAPLALATVQMRDGRATFSEYGGLGDARGTGRQLFWKKVPGNPFHERGKTRIQNASRSPYWSVSGEELLRAWAKVKRQEYDGMLAIDVPGIASLFTVTGPLEVEGYGTLDENNLVPTLVGSYDIYNDNTKRKQLNGTLLPIFREKMFAGGKFAEKIQVLGQAADARHFAMYLRDPKTQDLVRDLGIAGDLSDTDYDYLGVFTQNTNASKTDFWQRREVSSDVQLKADGSARVKLSVGIDNTSGPFPYPTPDPGSGYYTRIAKPAVGIFFPKNVRIRSSTVAGTEADLFLGSVQGRPYFSPTMTIEPGSTNSVEVEFDVPQAAAVGEDGSLTYRLDVDPQGMVNPQKLDVRVRWPAGYNVRGLPDEWTRQNDRTARWSVDALIDSPRWTLVGTPLTPPAHPDPPAGAP